MKENIFNNNLIEDKSNNLNVNNFDELNELNELINNSIVISNKIDLILLEWFKYDLLNRSSFIVNEINTLSPFILNLIKESYTTVKIYNNIGNIILDNMHIFIYLYSLTFFSIIIMNCFYFSILVYLYRKNRFIGYK
jgi:hypothetical protein